MQFVVLLRDPAGDVGAVHQGEEGRVGAVELDHRVDHGVQQPGQRQGEVRRGERLAVGLPHLVQQALAELDRDGFLVREVLVEGAGRDVRLAGDRVGAGRRVAVGAEDLRGGLEQLGDAPLAACLAAGRLRLLGPVIGPDG